MTTATAWVRKATAAGALLVPADAPWTLSAATQLGQWERLGLAGRCEHLEDGPEVDGRLVLVDQQECPTVGLVPTGGAQSFVLQCPACHPGALPVGCQVCGRALAPKVRLVVARPLPGSPLVLTGRVCVDCRRGWTDGAR